MSAIAGQKGTLDPFEMLSLYSMDLVMKNLPVKEILKFSMVSRQWFERTALLESFLGRVKVTTKCPAVTKNNEHDDCCYEHVDPESRRRLMESIRMYQTLKIYRCCDSRPSIRQVVGACRAQYWTSLEFSECTFVDLRAINLYMLNLEESLETLAFNRVAVKECGFDMLYNVEMPHLKVLKITQSSDTLLRGAFDHVTGLRELVVDFPVFNRTSMTSLSSILSRNNDLESLTMGAVVTEWALERFRNWPAEMTFAFKLKSIRLGFPSLNEYKDLSKSLVKFLELHRETLSTMVFTSAVGGEFLKEILGFPALTHLTLNRALYPHETCELQINEKLQHLSIPEIEEFDKIKIFTSSVPNIESLNIFKMDDSTMEHLMRVNKKLLHLTYGECALKTKTISERNVFPNLRSLHVSFYKKKVATSIYDSRLKSWQTNFQQLYSALLFNKSSVPITQKQHPIKFSDVPRRNNFGFRLR